MCIAVTMVSKQMWRVHFITKTVLLFALFDQIMQQNMPRSSVSHQRFSLDVLNPCVRPRARWPSLKSVKAMRCDLNIYLTMLFVLFSEDIQRHDWHRHMESVTSKNYVHDLFSDRPLVCWRTTDTYFHTRKSGFTLQLFKVDTLWYKQNSTRNWHPASIKYQIILKNCSQSIIMKLLFESQCHSQT